MDFHLCINSTYQTKKFYTSYKIIAKQAVLLNHQLAKKEYAQINAFLAGGDRVEKNLKALLMKAIESLGGGARKGILSFVNKNLGRSQNIVMRDWVTWM